MHISLLRPSCLQREAVVRWFNDAENFAAVHTQTLDEAPLEALIIE